jgi:hypothetical protein
MKMMFLTCSILMGGLAIRVGLIFSILALIRQFKRNPSKREMVRQVLVNEFTHNFVYLGLLYLYPDTQTVFVLIPIMIHSWVGVCDYTFMRKGKIYDRTICEYQLGLKITVDKTRNNKDTLMR